MLRWSPNESLISELLTLSENIAKHASFDKMAFPNEKKPLIFLTIVSFLLLDLFIFNLKAWIPL